MTRYATVVGVLVVGIILGIVVEHMPHFFAPRLLQLVLLLLVCLVAIRAARGAARDWFIGSASLLVGLIAIEGACVAIEPRPNAYDDSGMSRPRPIVGFGPAKPGLYQVVETRPNGSLIYDISVTIDSSLNRKTAPATGPDAVAFFGDSFTFGNGVGDGDTLPQRFADLHHGATPVLNLAFSGWSPAQNLAALQSGLYRRQLTSTHRFVLTTAAWHIERTSCKAAFSMRAPRYAPSAGGVELMGQCDGPAARAWRGFLSRFAAYRVLIQPVLDRPTRADVDTYLEIVATFVKTAEHDYGVKTTIIFLPYGDAYLKPSGVTENQLIAGLRDSGADVLVDALPPIADPKLYEIQGDGHPTPLANRARAVELDNHLKAIEMRSD